MDKWHQYLFGKYDITVHSDHQPLGTCKCECRLATNWTFTLNTRHRETNSQFQLHRWAFVKVNLTDSRTSIENWSTFVNSEHSTNYGIQVKTRWPSWSTLGTPLVRMLKTRMPTQELYVRKPDRTLSSAVTRPFSRNLWVELHAGFREWCWDCRTITSLFSTRNRGVSF